MRLEKVFGTKSLVTVSELQLDLVCDSYIIY